jgi:hypothetical protein
VVGVYMLCRCYVPSYSSSDEVRCSVLNSRRRSLLACDCCWCLCMILVMIREVVNVTIEEGLEGRSGAVA